MKYLYAYYDDITGKIEAGMLMLERYKSEVEGEGRKLLRVCSEKELGITYTAERLDAEYYVDLSGAIPVLTPLDQIPDPDTLAPAINSPILWAEVPTNTEILIDGVPYGNSELETSLELTFTVVATYSVLMRPPLPYAEKEWEIQSHG